MGLGAEMGWGVGVYGEGDGFGPLGMEMVWGRRWVLAGKWFRGWRWIWEEYGLGECVGLGREMGLGLLVMEMG